MLDRLLDLSIRYPIDLLSYLSSCFPIVLGAIRYRQLSRYATCVVLFFVFCFAKDTYALWRVIFALNTIFIQNLETVFQSALVGFIYYYCFDKVTSKRIIISMTVAAVIISILAFDSTKVSVTASVPFRLLAITLSLSYFNKILVDMRIKNVLLHTAFWFSAGLLLFAAGTFFIVLFSEYWYNDINKVPAEIFDKYWNASQILFIIFCGFSAYGIWVTKYDQENAL